MEPTQRPPFHSLKTKLLSHRPSSLWSHTFHWQDISASKNCVSLALTGIGHCHDRSAYTHQALTGIGLRHDRFAFHLGIGGIRGMWFYVELGRNFSLMCTTVLCTNAYGLPHNWRSSISCHLLMVDPLHPKRVSPLLHSPQASDGPCVGPL